MRDISAMDNVQDLSYTTKYYEPLSVRMPSRLIIELQQTTNYKNSDNPSKTVLYKDTVRAQLS